MSRAVVEVSKSQNESGLNLIRRFQKRVQESGVLNRARAARYSERPASKLARKHSALNRLAKRAVYERLKKLGKIPDQPMRRGRR